MLETIEFRRARNKDAASLSCLHAALFPHGWTASEWYQLLGQQGHRALVAENAGRCVGFILVSQVLDEAEILTLGVDAAYRRQNLATQLLTQCVEQLEQSGIANLWLEVADDNHPAISFYGKHGFTVMSRRPDYYRQARLTSVDALVMQRRIG